MSQSMNQHAFNLQQQDEGEEIKLDQEDLPPKVASSPNQQLSQSAMSPQISPLTLSSDNKIANCVDCLRQSFWELQVLFNARKNRIFISDKGCYKGIQTKARELKEIANIMCSIGDSFDHIEFDFKENQQLEDDGMVHLLKILDSNPRLKQIELNFRMNKTFSEASFSTFFQAIEKLKSLESLILNFQDNSKFTEANLGQLGQTLRKLPQISQLEIDFANSSISDAKKMAFCKIVSLEKPIPSLKIRIGFLTINSFQELIRKPECSIF